MVSTMASQQEGTPIFFHCPQTCMLRRLVICKLTTGACMVVCFVCLRVAMTGNMSRCTASITQ